MNKLLFLSLLFSLAPIACNERDDEKAAVIPQAPETPDVSKLYPLRREETLRQFEAYVTNAPGLLSGDLSDLCSTQVEFVKGLRATLFPGITLEELQCQENSKLGTLVNTLNFKAKDGSVTADYNLTCAQYNSFESWRCWGMSSTATETLDKSQSLRLLEDVFFSDSLQTFADKKVEGALKLFGHNIHDVVAVISQKAQSEGLEYMPFREAPGFERGGNIIKFSLEDITSDGLRGRVVFQDIPEIWFKPIDGASSPYFHLLNCGDRSCLDNTYFEIRGKVFLLTKRTESQPSSYVLSFDIQSAWFDGLKQ